MGITVQELINKLMKVEDKSKEVIIGVLSGHYYSYKGIDRIEDYEYDITIFTND